MRQTTRIALCIAAGAAIAAGGAYAATAPAKPAAKPAAAGAPAWTVDKANSKIRFKSAFAGTAFEGGFSRWDATINFDPKNLAGSKAVVNVDMTSAASGDGDRDSTMPTADWFNTAKFPKATFTSTGFKDLGGGKYQATGNLTMKGVTKPVVLPFTLAIQGTTARMNGQVVIKRNDFGVGQGQFAGADTVPFEVTVPISVVAKRG